MHWFHLGVWFRSVAGSSSADQYGIFCHEGRGYAGFDGLHMNVLGWASNIYSILRKPMVEQ